MGPERRLDTGPLWFVGVLLVFSLGYAGWRAAGCARAPAPGGPTARPDHRAHPALRR